MRSARVVAAASFVAIASMAPIAGADNVVLPKLDWEMTMEGAWTVTEDGAHLETLAVTQDGKSYGLFYVDVSRDACATRFDLQASVISVSGGWMVDTPKMFSPWFPMSIRRMSYVPDKDKSGSRVWFCRNLKHGALEVEGPGDSDIGLRYLGELLEALDDVATQAGNPSPRYRQTAASIRAKYPQLAGEKPPTDSPAPAHAPTPTPDATTEASEIDDDSNTPSTPPSDTGATASSDASASSDSSPSVAAADTSAPAGGDSTYTPDYSPPTYASPSIAPAPDTSASVDVSRPRATSGFRFIGFADLMSTETGSTPYRFGAGLEAPARFRGDRGVAIAASATAGLTDGAFTGDAHVGVGYGVGGERWQAAVTIDLGADRTAGGKLPGPDGAPYTGQELQLRIGGALALEGRAMLVERSSGDRDENRFSIGLVTTRFGAPMSVVLERETWGGQKLTGLRFGIDL